MEKATKKKDFFLKEQKKDYKSNKINSSFIKYIQQ